MCSRFEADLKAAQEKFIARLKEADGLGEAQDILNKADSDFQQEVEDIIVTQTACRRKKSG